MTQELGPSVGLAGSEEKPATDARTVGPSADETRPPFSAPDPTGNLVLSPRPQPSERATLTDLPTTDKLWSGWSAEAVDLLRKLYPDGHAFSVLAAEIGRVCGRGLERNAVISKAHRIKLPPRGDQNGLQRAERLRHRREAKLSAAPADRRLTNNNPLRSKGNRGGNNNPLGFGSRKAKVKPSPVSLPPAPLPPPPVIEDLAEPVSLNVSLMALNDRMCKFPHGDPGTAGFHFCGHRNFNGLPYCEYHSRVAFRAPYRNETITRLERIASAP